MLKQYIKKSIAIKAKIFEPGDEDGFETDNSKDEFDKRERRIPYIIINGRQLFGEFGKCYLLINSYNQKSLIEKDIFEEIYQEIEQPYTT
jgi:hypothetical protein